MSFWMVANTKGRSWLEKWLAAGESPIASCEAFRAWVSGAFSHSLQAFVFFQRRVRCTHFQYITSHRFASHARMMAGYNPRTISCTCIYIYIIHLSLSLSIYTYTYVWQLSSLVKWFVFNRRTPPLQFEQQPSSDLRCYGGTPHCGMCSISHNIYIPSGYLTLKMAIYSGFSH